MGEGINKLCHFRDVIIEFGRGKLFGKQLEKINRGNFWFRQGWLVAQQWNTKNPRIRMRMRQWMVVDDVDGWLVG